MKIRVPLMVFMVMGGAFLLYSCPKSPEDTGVVENPKVNVPTTAPRKSPMQQPSEEAAPKEEVTKGKSEGSAEQGKSEEQGEEEESETEPSGGETAASEDPYHGLVPVVRSDAPKITEAVKVQMVTDAGDLLIEVYPEAAPNAAQRFLELVKMGFYDNTPIFRVVPGFVAQFGINWRESFNQWREKNFPDDPSYFKLLPGTICFARSGAPNSQTTQVFINFRDNTQLRAQGFTVFGRVVEGMQVAKSWKSVGDPSMGLDQQKLWTDGENYLKGLSEKPNTIIKMRILP